MRSLLASCLLALAALTAGATAETALRGTGDLGVIVERAAGSLLIVDTSKHEIIDRVEGLGDLSHASVVYSRDERYAFVFGRDGGLSKIDILTGTIVKRVVQGGNAIGGAISDDGALVAVSNYEPGGVRVFDTETLDLVADIPAVHGGAGEQSKTVGLVDAPGRRFLFSLWDAGETWIADFSKGDTPEITKFAGIGANPYDGLISGDGRHYIAGLFGEDGLAHIDLWKEPLGVERILDGYGRGEKKLPVYKMPHLEGWALAGDRFFLPAVGRHELLVLDARDFTEIGRVPVKGQPVFAVARPDGRQIWVNFALPDNRFVQVVDAVSLEIVKTFELGPAVLHLEFAPRGHQVWISVRDADRIDIFDTRSFAKIAELPAGKPSGIFFTARAHKTGL